MMMLKFGRVVNLDALEGLTTNKVINELEKKVRGQERAGDRQMRALEVSRERGREEEEEKEEVEER